MNADSNIPESRALRHRDAAHGVYEDLRQRLSEGSPQPRLAPTRRAVEILGDPHLVAPVIHLTGTNGKTSTSRMIESLLRATGLRTGMLTSPHLLYFTERICIDGEPIADEAIVRNWAEVKPIIGLVDAELRATDELPLTFFEALTVLAFACFADAPVDVMVLEVGMGGEWDATNVADGQVAVFTPIAIDHVDRLGSTVTEIARTKSGIIKPAAAVVSAAQTVEALAVLQEAADLREAHLRLADIDFAVSSSEPAPEGIRLTVRGIATDYPDLVLPLHGSHQAQNAALAVAAVEAFIGDGRVPLATEIVETGLATATSPGRLQRLSRSPLTLVDVAHNPHGIAALLAALADYPGVDEFALVCGVLADKDWDGMARLLAPAAARFFVTNPTSDRSLAPPLFATALRTHGAHRVDTVPEAHDALNAARDWASAAPRRAVVVTGSVVLVGDVMASAHA
ncbi:MAG: dihydrofolate synthase [Candidatus Lumbricidophila eiseniae]|uniref:tetrahydrofolate synthase n=1 Tax=Candidatus Lumbricidiphila eiseniae TaxID=1969409 RepID=A0A2A6FP93_9MICO|nr:MAG: dihydrofolate synthase [Candidatus Lumbricidophila eiseniae]